MFSIALLCVLFLTLLTILNVEESNVFYYYFTLHALGTYAFRCFPTPKNFAQRVPSSNKYIHDGYLDIVNVRQLAKAFAKKSKVRRKLFNSSWTTILWSCNKHLVITITSYLTLILRLIGFRQREHIIIFYYKTECSTPVQSYNFAVVNAWGF